MVNCAFHLKRLKSEMKVMTEKKLKQNNEKGKKIDTNGVSREKKTKPAGNRMVCSTTYTDTVGSHVTVISLVATPKCAERA